MFQRNCHLSVCLVLLFAAIFVFNGGLEPINALNMNEMPEDPVNGKMVMTKAYNFELKNGQKLRFTSQETLDAFLKDPKMGVKGVSSLPATHDHDQQDDNVLCPVCGMESSVFSGPQVVMKHGNQAVHTCSMTHARELYEDILSFQSKKQGAAAKKTHGFCSGPGTTMLNGFSAAGSSTPCILLWFSGWVLDTRVRYILGGILVALVAIFNEYLLHLRRVLRDESNIKRMLSRNTAAHTAENAHLLWSSPQNMPLVDSSGPSWFRKLSHETQHGIHSLLHGVTLFFAYMLMLVSMTYDFTLLLWVVAGYVVGHYIFGERREAPLCSGEMESHFP